MLPRRLCWRGVTGRESGAAAAAADGARLYRLPSRGVTLALAPAELSDKRSAGTNSSCCCEPDPGLLSHCLLLLGSASAAAGRG